MRVYWIVFLVTLIIQLFPVHSESGNRWRLFFTFIPLFLFGALRIDFGLDYEDYEDIYYGSHYWTSLSDASEHSEIGYLLLNKVIPSWRLLIIITSALTCFAYSIIFYKLIPTSKYWLAICLLFLSGDKAIFFMYSGIRNSVAIVIMLLSLSLVRDRKIVPYFILTFLAMQFHTTAVLFMPLVYLLCNSKPMQKREAIVWLCALVILQLISLESVFESSTQLIDQYFDRYSSYSYRLAETDDNRSFIIRFSVTLFVVGMIWFMRITKLKPNENLICRGALLYAMSYMLGALSLRFSQCFIMFFVCGVTILVNEWKKKQLAWGYLSFTMLFLGYAFFVVWMQKDLFPYQIYHSVIGDY